MRNNNSLGSDSKLLSLFDSLFPIIVLVILLFINVNIYGDASLDGSNQFILIIGAAIAYLFGLKNKVSSSTIFSSISSNIKVNKHSYINLASCWSFVWNMVIEWNNSIYGLLWI